MIFVCYVTDYSVIYASLCHKYGQIYIILLLKFATHVHDNMFCDLIIRFSLATNKDIVILPIYLHRKTKHNGFERPVYFISSKNAYNTV